MKKVISVRFKENGKSYYFDPAGADIKTGEYVIVETARGIECGEVVQGAVLSRKMLSFSGKICMLCGKRN